MQWTKHTDTEESHAKNDIVFLNSSNDKFKFKRFYPNLCWQQYIQLNLCKNHVFRYLGSLNWQVIHCHDIDFITQDISIS